MITEQTNHIGTILHFDEPKYMQVLEAWDRIIAKVNKAIDVYLNLGIGNTSKLDIKDFLQSDSTNIAKLYKQSVDKNLKDLKITAKAVISSFHRNIGKDMEELDAALNEIKTQLIEERELEYKFYQDFDSVKCNDNNAFLPKEAKEEIRKKFQIVIETDNQNEVYQLYLDAKTALQKLKAKAYTPNGFRFPFLGFSSSMFPVNEEGEITMVPNVMPLLK